MAKSNISEKRMSYSVVTPAQSIQLFFKTSCAQSIHILNVDAESTQSPCHRLDTYRPVESLTMHTDMIIGTQSAQQCFSIRRTNKTQTRQKT